MKKAKCVAPAAKNGMFGCDRISKNGKIDRQR